MSRGIKNDHPWSDDEKEYFLARSGGKDLVALNEELFPPGSKGKEAKEDDNPTVELSQEVYDHVAGLSVEDLKKELEANGLSTDAKQENQLRVRLAQHLQDIEDKKSK